jgi:hypothetical protein
MDKADIMCYRYDPATGYCKVAGAHRTNYYSEGLAGFPESCNKIRNLSGALPQPGWVTCPDCRSACKQEKLCSNYNPATGYCANIDRKADFRSLCYKNGNDCPNHIEGSMRLRTAERATGSSSGCYVATCVYGSYDCPEVWTLRRFRDNSLKYSSFGRQFIRVYYTISPKMVKAFENKRWFHKFWKSLIDKIVSRLQNNGVESNPYSDNAD